MQKELVINSDSCIINKTQYGVKINDKDIEELIAENLPKDMKEYKDYPAKINISISIVGGEPLEIQTLGYEKEIITEQEESNNAV